MGKPRPVKEGDKWRLKIDAVDGDAHSVHIQLPDRDVLNGSYVRYVAQQLCVAEDELDGVLADWTPDQLCEHLQKQDAKELRSRVFGIKG
jgi:hypothetical protein